LYFFIHFTTSFLRRLYQISIELDAKIFIIPAAPPYLIIRKKSYKKDFFVLVLFNGIFFKKV
ncbi:TPA: hypothetical protein ACQOJ1_001766, partial [Streptococcus pyogenes]